MTDTARMSAESFLARLAERGIDYVFANAGTDFAPIIEALSRGPGSNRAYPRVITVPHENVAVSMAHGYYRVSGKPAVVMVHVTVGTANTVCALMNAARDNVPVILGAGRTPLTETGHQASRNRSIHWGQEMFDQGSLVREFVKWDYELRAGQPVDAIVDRALDIAMSEPRGPVYLTLPREVLCDAAVAPRRNGARPLGASSAVPSRAAIEEAAALLAKAEFPLILTSSAGRTAEAMAGLTALAEDFALPVVQSEARDVSLSTAHPMCLGFDASAHLGKADVIAVFDSAVPWIPRLHPLRPHAKVICFGPDPLFTRYPFREFEGDLLVTGESAAAFAMLREALGEAMAGKGAAIEARRKAIAGLRAEMLAKRAKLIDQVKDQTPIHPLYLAHCLNELKARDAIIVNELGLPVSGLDITTPCSYLGSSLAGGLGFGLGAGLGAKLAAPGARGDRGGRRRLVLFRQSARLPLRRPGRKAADADHHRQQPRLARGAAGDPRCLPRRPCRQGQCDAAGGTQPRPGFRDGGAILRRLRREGHGAGTIDAGAAPRLRGHPLRDACATQRDHAEPGVSESLPGFGEGGRAEARPGGVLQRPSGIIEERRAVERTPPRPSPKPGREKKPPWR